jgi:hypothetical protein
MSANQNVLEWTTRNKGDWGRGPWQSEPDKVQWVDEATGLDCLIVRGPSGALCGYVGVPETHPYHGKDYSSCALAEPCGEAWCEHSPESAMHVHGGLTFADTCHEPTREAFARWCEMMRSCEDEAAKYPRGDAAQRLRDHGHLRNDFDAWKAWGEGSFICHRKLDGRPDRVWWFGFDCAHSGDFTPKYANSLGGLLNDGVYRDRDYVEGEVAQLAAQLKRVGEAGV